MYLLNTQQDMDPNMMASQVMAPAQFFYCSPDQTLGNRQHRHLSQQPAMQHMSMYPVVPTLPSTLVYSKPSSSCSQPATQPKMLSVIPSNLTPMASPKLAYQGPTIILQNGAAKLMLETEMYDNENSYYPATPALCTAGSHVGYPGSSDDMLATLINPMFSGFDGFENVKPDVVALPDGMEAQNWTNSVSPPMTPSYLSQSQTGPSSVTSGCINPRDILSVSGVSTTKFTCLAAIEQFKTDTLKPTVLATFELNPVLHHRLPSFDEHSDLESEEDVFSGIVNLHKKSAKDLQRSRSATCSTILFPFVGGVETAYEDTTSVAVTRIATLGSPSEDEARPAKKAGSAPQQQSAAEEESSKAQTVENSNATDAATPNLPTPAKRRGRKQSLTDDLTKPFVCELCSRRFRRQEHLKRHYRSLHIQDKAFECSDCGKKFSRNDNLVQHIRTHGDSTIVTNLINDPDHNSFSKVLFQVDSEVSGSSGSEFSSDESNVRLSGKRRKRSA
ncbi:hypothetical protein BKA67DRAFT_117973 [Truncatella angustata]|uniref:C2H2-type domain-containing protein n=1 Tax=Truncatella angustata TaxID=152316 RepID=A0A9P8UCB7_9PEZI|nr:uncharacterized protein BKA67DRAFT_117973 [Truncatella angustata]KAH6645577.1 hypothetical protein BKA67DRAFT_117973 [Truncatella angustata]